MRSLWWNRGRNNIFLVPDLHPNQWPSLPFHSEGHSFSRKTKQFIFFCLRLINHQSIWEWNTNPNKIQHCIFDNFMAKEAELWLRYRTNRLRLATIQLTPVLCLPSASPKERLLPFSANRLWRAVGQVLCTTVSGVFGMSLLAHGEKQMVEKQTPHCPEQWVVAPACAQYVQNATLPRQVYY